MTPFRDLVKALLPRLPRPVDRTLTELLYRLGLAPLGYRAFVRLGRPQVVAAGPFAGMATLDRAVGAAFPPKVLGTYELEIQPWIEALIQGPPVAVLINIGAAEGADAIGLLRRLPALRALCFDTDPVAQRLIRILAAKNGVSARLEAHGLCRPQHLEAALAASPSALVLSDCEGGEDALLDPEQCPGLAGATILVELHEMFVPGVGARLRARFAASHDIEEEVARPRQPSDLGPNFLLTEDEALALLEEWRHPEQSWLLMRPRATPRSREAK